MITTLFLHASYIRRYWQIWRCAQKTFQIRGGWQVVSFTSQNNRREGMNCTKAGPSLTNSVLNSILVPRRDEKGRNEPERAHKAVHGLYVGMGFRVTAAVSIVSLARYFAFKAFFAFLLWLW